MRRTERDRRAILGKMPSRALTDLIIALLHEVCCGRHGGRHHRRSAIAPTSPPPLPTSAAPHRKVMERPLSPSPDRLVNWPLVLLDPDAHPRGH
jgi:hypothetical protein